MVAAPIRRLRRLSGSISPGVVEEVFKLDVGHFGDTDPVIIIRPDRLLGVASGNQDEVAAGRG